MNFVRSLTALVACQLLSFAAASASAHAQTIADSAEVSTTAVTLTAVDQCLQLEVLKTENAERTVAMLRADCETRTSVDAALSPETGFMGQMSFNRFFRPYKDNYLLFGRMKMDDGTVPFSGENLDTKFELGLTFSLFEGRKNFEFLAPLHFGYSQQSWWDIAEDSAPFREHNYNPEVYWLFDQPRRPLIGRIPFVDLIGLEHQSNGRDGLTSRSWDRIYAQKEFELLPQLSVGVKIWDILQEGEFNKDIRHYLGNGELSVMFKPNERTNLRWRVRQGNNVDTLSYTFDIYYRRPNVNGAFFIQYHDGYGEALITYNRKTQSLRGGFYFPLDIFD
jgi:phospholipase A1/A2